MSINRNIVWIIDGETDLCLLLKVYYLRKNYKVRLFHTCTDILNVLESEAPNLVYLDKRLCDNPEEIIKAIQDASPGVRINVSSPGTPKYNPKI